MRKTQQILFFSCCVSTKTSLELPHISQQSVFTLHNSAMYVIIYVIACNSAMHVIICYCMHFSNACYYMLLHAIQQCMLLYVIACNLQCMLLYVIACNSAMHVIIYVIACNSAMHVIIYVIACNSAMHVIICYCMQFTMHVIFKSK